jgi:hypothetical protein
MTTCQVTLLCAPLSVISWKEVTSFQCRKKVKVNFARPDGRILISVLARSALRSHAFIFCFST